MSNDNLKLWDSVCKTDPKYAKEASKGAYKFTSISPMYQFRKATDAFGVQGIGWGIEPGSEKFTEHSYGSTVILSYDATLFFVHEGQRGVIPIHASEKVCYQTRGQNAYLKIDDEARKKVVTNAKTKGLSELGFNADVFMGQFDDPNYVEFRNYEAGIEAAEERDAKILEETQKLGEWCKKELATQETIKNAHALGVVHRKNCQTITNKCGVLGIDSKPYLLAFERSFNKQMEQIKKDKAA